MNQKKLLTHQVLQEADKKLLFEKEDQIAAQADAISTTVFRHPELGNEERFTSKFLAEEAAKAGAMMTALPLLFLRSMTRCRGMAPEEIRMDMPADITGLLPAPSRPQLL